jgi:hypothetical protein
MHQQNHAQTPLLGEDHPVPHRLEAALTEEEEVHQEEEEAHQEEEEAPLVEDRQDFLEEAFQDSILLHQRCQGSMGLWAYNW